MKEKNTIQTIINILKQNYPKVKCSLKYNTAWQLLLATMLSAQCKDETVNKVTTILFEKYPSIQEINLLDVKILEKYIYSTGFYHNKAKNIKKAAEYLLINFQGNVPNSMDELVKIPGVARKIANVVLTEWFAKDFGIVVDTHVKRISARIGWTNQTNPEKIEQYLLKLIPQPEWKDLSLLLIAHGRDICDAKKPKCEQCRLNKYCKYYQKQLNSN